MTSAPKSASCSDSMLPATMRVRSSTRMPSRGPVAAGSNLIGCIGCVCCIGRLSPTGGQYASRRHLLLGDVEVLGPRTEQVGETPQGLAQLLQGWRRQGQAHRVRRVAVPDREGARRCEAYAPPRRRRNEGLGSPVVWQGEPKMIGAGIGLDGEAREKGCRGMLPLLGLLALSRCDHSRSAVGQIGRAHV